MTTSALLVIGLLGFIFGISNGPNPGDANCQQDKQCAAKELELQKKLNSKISVDTQK